MAQPSKIFFSFFADSGEILRKLNVQSVIFYIIFERNSLVGKLAYNLPYTGNRSTGHHESQIAFRRESHRAVIAPSESKQFLQNISVRTDIFFSPFTALLPKSVDLLL